MPLKPWVKELRKGPKQYQQGWCEFYKLKFKLTPDVLIPRPETELLVDAVLMLAKPVTRNQQPVTILDVGTGSGCIAVAIAKNLPNVRILALDISKDALKIAEQNAKFHKVSNKIFFLESDLLSFIVRAKRELSNETSHFRSKSNPDIIVANLPYIPTARLMHIDPLVSEWEPKIALDGGNDGFELYTKLFTQMKERRIFPKYLLCEIDETQGELATQIAKQYFPKADVEVKIDLAKKDRILEILFH